MQILSLRNIAASALSFALTAPAVGATVTYTVSGTFADGGTFGGTFGYDPVANTFANTPDLGPTGQFDITTTSGSQLTGRHFQPASFVNGGYSDTNSSSPTELYIDLCCTAGTSQLILDWNTPLNAVGGGSPQAIIGGRENYAQAISFPIVTRLVTGGFVESSTSPVPLPAAVWLMLSGLVGLTASLRPRRVELA
jgi:hypothetical protein